MKGRKRLCLHLFVRKKSFLGAEALLVQCSNMIFSVRGCREQEVLGYLHCPQFSPCIPGKSHIKRVIAVACRRREERMTIDKQLRCTSMPRDSSPPCAPSTVKVPRVFCPGSDFLNSRGKSGFDCACCCPILVITRVRGGMANNAGIFVPSTQKKENGGVHNTHISSASKVDGDIRSSKPRPD